MSKHYTGEFKYEAVKLALSSDDSLLSTAKKLVVSPSALSNWVKMDKKAKDTGGDMATVKELTDEVKRLKKELAQSKQVEQILKKAMAYFTKEVK